MYRFLNLARPHPDALILGRPVFGATLPRERAFPRDIQRFLGEPRDRRRVARLGSVWCLMRYWSPGASSPDGGSRPVSLSAVPAKNAGLSEFRSVMKSEQDEIHAGMVGRSAGWG